MSPKTRRLITYGVHAAIVAVLAIVLYIQFVPTLNLNDPLYKVYADAPLAWNVRCWSDALFIPGVLVAGVGGLMWIATTGFFDFLRYAAHSIYVRFAPTKDVRELETFYDFKLARMEAREKKPITLAGLLVGLATILIALVLAIINVNMIGG